MPDTPNVSDKNLDRNPAFHISFPHQEDEENEMKKAKLVIKAMILTFVMTMMVSIPVFAEDVSQVNDQLLTDINNLRASQGLSALSLDSQLCGYANVRAQEASSAWSHTRPDGSQGCDMISASKWRGENLSYVQYSGFGFSSEEQAQAAQLMYDNLVASPTHYSNMVFGSYTRIGIATYVSDSGSGTKLTTAYMFSN